jgi:nitrite reductase (NO-forming)
MRRVLSAVAVAVLAVSALGAASATAGAAPASVLATAVAVAGPTIEVTGRSFAFVPNRITVPAGQRVTIVFHSTDVFHDLVVQGVGRVVKANGTKTRRGTLLIRKPGTYKFWCSVRGHRSGGMKGTIVAQ